MPYIYEDTLQGETRNALTIPSTTGEVLSAQFQQSYEENPIMAIKRLSDLGEAQVTGPRVSAEDARTVLQAAGMENDIRVSDAGITRAALNTLIERKRVEKRRQEVFARSEGGFGEGAARFGVAVGATLADPVSFGLNFVPVVGQARYARWLNTARSLGARIAIRGAVGAAEGTVGAAIAEVPIYAMRTQEQADYDMADSLLNVAFGGVIGAGLHTTVGSVGELISRRVPSRAAPVARVEPVIGEAPVRAAEPLPTDIQRAIFDLGTAQRRVESMAPEARQAALRAAVGQAVEGRAIDIESIVPPSRPQGRWRVDGRNLWELSAVELTGAAETVRTRTVQMLTEIFGNEEDARWYATAEFSPSVEARANSLLAKLSPEKRKQVERWENGEFLTRDEVLRIARDMTAIRSSQSPEELAQFMKRAVINIGDAVDPRVMNEQQLTAYMEMQEGYRIAQERGWKTQELSDLTMRAASAQFNSPEDAEFMLQRWKRRPPQDPEAAREYRLAEESAQKALAREVESGAEANLKAAEEEADLAVSDATEITKRLGVDMKEDADFAAVMEGVDKAERWARVAELATVCLVRGG